MASFIQDIEGLFSGIKSALVSPATTDVAAASVDAIKKAVALAQTAEHLASTFVNDAETTWSNLDNQPLASIASSVAGLVHTGDYEKAAFGLMYLVYQGAIESTNKAESVLKGVASNLTTDVQAGATKAEAEVTGIVGKVEAEASKIWTEVKDGVENVVNKVEGVFGGSQAQATTAAPVAPNVQTNPVPPVTQAQLAAAGVDPSIISAVVAAASTVTTSSAPAVAVANPPQTTPAAAKPVLAS